MFKDGGWEMYFYEGGLHSVSIETSLSVERRLVYGDKAETNIFLYVDKSLHW